ncbi:MAG: family 16 glycoside hydrolase [Verrucomicrobiota bacterium]
MKKSPLYVGIVLVSILSTPLHGNDEAKFESIFDGQTLSHWDGDPEHWTVEDGAITGTTTAEAPIPENKFIIWRAGEVDDFVLELDYRIMGGNSGIQYRSFEIEGKEWVLGGYQADIDSSPKHSGIVYGEKFRGILAKLGEKTIIGASHKPESREQFGDAEELQAAIKSEDWNHYRIVASGYKVEHFINGKLMSSTVDEDLEQRRRGGLLGFQIHKGPPMKVQFKNIRLKRLPLEDKKKVAFFAGTPSHGWGAHEHRAGCLLLANALNENLGDQVHAVVYDNGWPSDPTAFQNTDAVVMFSDGSRRHMVKNHLAEMDHYAKRGVGIGCIHFAVEIEIGEGGERFLDWIGGYFETDWSVNPHWEADFQSLPDHPVANGVQPFKILDEWYYHMRFREGMKGVTPILTALPPESSLTRKDGPHSNNSHVRAAVLERKEPQHVMWVSESETNRGFGFTGAHFHHNWADDNFRRVVLNAVAWIAGIGVPADGVPSMTPDEAGLEANQDFPKPSPEELEKKRKQREERLKKQQRAA